MATNFEQILDEITKESTTQEKIDGYAIGYINTNFSRDPCKNFIQTRINCPWPNINRYCEIFGNDINSRDVIKEFSLTNLRDENNISVIIKAGDVDVFSGRIEEELNEFSEAYKNCAKKTENFILIFDPRVKKGGDQLRINYENARKALENTNAKILCEGTYFHAMLFEKKDSSYEIIVWESKVRNKEDGTPGRIDGFPHPPELSIYTGFIIDKNHKFYDICRRNIEVPIERIDKDALDEFVKRVEGRNDVIFNPKTNSYLFLGLPQYIKHLGKISEKI